MTVLELAKLAFEQNRAYCRAMGDDSIKEWHKAEDKQRKGAIYGVVYLLRTPNVNAGSLHQGLYRQLVAAGYSQGDTIDHEHKTHPGCLPFEQMPEDFRTKAVLFANLVEQMKPFIKG